MSEQTATLPASIVSPTDVSRLLREIESIDGFFTDSKIRKPGQPVEMPRLSNLMDKYVTQNQLNLLQETDRATILNDLKNLHSSAPVMHISFSVDPPGSYVQKIVSWIRLNIDSTALVTVGLQPNIGAGCVVRTTNKLFDLSLRNFFSGQRDYFIERLHIAVAEPDETPVPVQSQDVTPVTSPEHPPAVAVSEAPVEQASVTNSDQTEISKGSVGETANSSIDDNTPTEGLVPTAIEGQESVVIAPQAPVESQTPAGEVS